MAQSLVRELNIIILRAPDLEAERVFFAEVMGLKVDDETPLFLQVRAADGQGPVLGVGIGEPSVSGPELWWRTEDTDALHATLLAKGVRILEAPKDMPFGRAIQFADPAGNRLCAFQEPR
ncbi:MAG: VOC family protein [Ktedonobacterales bacterium]